MNAHCRSGTTDYDSVLKALQDQGFTVLNIEEHESGMDPNEIILKYQHDTQFVIVGGGDGSVNMVLPSLARTKLPLLVLPMGTANNLARTYELPNRIEDSLKLLSNGKVISIDLGRVNGILFVNVAGMGLSTEINRKVSSKLKKHLGVFAFILTGLRLIYRMNPFRAWITTSGNKRIPSKSWQISVCNGVYYGSGLKIKHNASLDDEQLHLLSTEVKYWWKGFALIPSLMTGRYNRDQEITLLADHSLKIETRRKLRIDVDGDIKTTTPAVFDVLPQALKLIVPKNLN